MNYVPGRFSSSEAARIAFLCGRPEPNKTALQIFTVYLRSVEDTKSHASSRGTREDFIDSLLELASFLGEEAREAAQALAKRDIPDVIAHLTSLKVHPNDRNPRNSLIVSGSTTAEVLAAVKEFTSARGIELIVR